MIMQIKLALAAAALAGLLYVGWRVVDVLSNARVVKATETINQEGRDAADAIAEARARVRHCHLSGGLWDRATGQCRPAVPGAGK